MSEEDVVSDWQKQRGPVMLGLAGAVLVGLEMTAPGFILIVGALLYAAYTSDAAMKKKQEFY